VPLQQPLFRWANWQTYQQRKLAQAICEAQVVHWRRYS
jgi:outer membrane protein